MKPILITLLTALIFYTGMHLCLAIGNELARGLQSGQDVMKNYRIQIEEVER